MARNSPQSQNNTLFNGRTYPKTLKAWFPSLVPQKELQKSKGKEEKDDQEKKKSCTLFFLSFLQPSMVDIIPWSNDHIAPRLSKVL